MATELPSLIGYAVYPPARPGLPYLAVTFMPDGTVVARQFPTETEATQYTNAMAKGRAPILFVIEEHEL